MIIVFFTDTYDKGKHPIPATAKRFFDILTSAGHEVRVAGIGNIPDQTYSARKRRLFLCPFLGYLQGISYAKLLPETLEKALENADIIHNFFPFSMEKKAELAARLHDIPVICSSGVDLKGYQKLVFLGKISAFNPITAHLMQFNYFQKYKNILCHSTKIRDELTGFQYPQTLHSLDLQADEDSVVLDKLLMAYEKARKDDLAEYKNKSRQIFKRNWAILPMSVDPTNPYRSGNIFSRIRDAICYFLIVGICAIPNFLFYGLHIKGHKNISRLKSGAFSVSNHIHNIDATMVAAALAPKKITFTSMTGNFKLPLVRWVLKWVGVVPIPPNTKSLNQFFQKTIEFAKNGSVVHFYPEGSMWAYSKTLRPFKKGAFHLAIDAGVPVIPSAISLRNPGKIYRLFRRKPLFTVNVLPPVYPDPELEGQKQVNDLRDRVHRAIQEKLQ